MPNTPSLSHGQSPFKTIPLTKTPSSLFASSKPATLQTETSAKIALGLLSGALPNLAWQRACLLAAITACLFPVAARGQQVSETTNTSITTSITSDDDLAKYDQLVDQIYTSVQDAHEASMQFYVNGLELSLIHI